MYSRNLPSRVANCASRTKKVSVAEKARMDAHFAAEKARRAKFLEDLAALLGGVKAPKGDVVDAIAKLGGVPEHWYFTFKWDAIKAWSL